jgi:hypothetical protein
MCERQYEQTEVEKLKDDYDNFIAAVADYAKLLTEEDYGTCLLELCSLKKKELFK